MTFQDQYKHPKWQKKRFEIMKRDKFCCALCGNDQLQLQVHHKRYGKGKVWEVDDDDLITVCLNCHDFIKLVDQKDLSGIKTYSASWGENDEEPANTCFIGFHNGNIFMRFNDNVFAEMGEYSKKWIETMVEKYKLSGGRLDKITS